MIRHLFTDQFVGFVGVGLTAAVIHWLARIALSLWLSFPLAVALAYAVGMAVAFALNSLYVFPGSSKPKMLQARDFAGVNFAFFPVVWAAALFFNHLLQQLGMVRFREALAHGTAVAVPMFATFFIYKFHTFKSGFDGQR